MCGWDSFVSVLLNVTEFEHKNFQKKILQILRLVSNILCYALC
jgi:hypothetical protein